MSDWEALAAALADIDRRLGMGRGFGLSPKQPPMQSVLTAARERLAQMPGECGNCYSTGSWFGDGIEHDHDGTPLGVCHLCHGKGYLYPPVLVERIAETIYGRRFVGSRGSAEVIAVAVLDALQTVPTPEEVAK